MIFAQNAIVDAIDRKKLKIKLKRQNKKKYFKNLNKHVLKHQF